MEASKEQALKWAESDSVVGGTFASDFALSSWSEVDASNLPVGLDYFLFDASCTVGTSTALRWLRLVTGHGAVSANLVRALDATDYKQLSYFDPEVVISGIEMLWRRRIKAGFGIETEARKHTNHVNRVKHRALKLISEQVEA